MSCSPAQFARYELLCDALKCRSTKDVKILLSEDTAEVNCGSENFCDTPLHLAVRNSNLEVVEMLLSKHADVHVRDRNGKIPLHLAAANGSKEIAGLLLSNGSKPDFRDADGVAPLHVSADKGCTEVVQELLKRNASVDLVCTSSLHDGYTALHFASENGHLQVVEVLLAQGADVDATDKYGATAVHFSVEKGHTLITQELLNHGACINQACTSGWQEGYTPLHRIAEIEDNRPHLVELLLESGAVVNTVTEYGYTPLHLAAMFNRKKVAQLLLLQGADVNATDNDGKTVLYYASSIASEIVDDILKCEPDLDIEYNKLALYSAIDGLGGYNSEFKEVIESLLNYGFNLKPEDAKDCKLLHTCVKLGYFRVVETLLRYGADCDSPLLGKGKKGNTLLHTAVQSRKLDIAMLLVKYGANINARDKTGQTPICYAMVCCDKSDLAMVEFLLLNGANVKSFFKPLHIAIKEKDIGNVKKLLKYGADVDAPDECGFTPLSLAISQKYEEIAKLLIRKGADVNISNQSDMGTVLHFAAYKGCDIVVRFLLEYANVNINSRDDRGMLPMYYAVLGGHVTVVNNILAYGFDINYRDDSGRTVLHIASRSGSLEVVELMLEHGADVNSTDIEGMTPIHVAIGGTHSYPSLPAIDLEKNDDNHSLYKDIVELYIKHMTMKKAKNLYLSDSNLLTLSYSPFHLKCQKEIEEMRRRKFDDNLTLCDILTKDVNELALYVKHVKIRQINELDYKTQFPLYAKILKRKIEKGKVRSDLLHLCGSKIDSLFKSVFPHLVLQRILIYLDDKDLENLINV